MPHAALVIMYYAKKGYGGVDISSSPSSSSSSSPSSLAKQYFFNHGLP
jgi:hypothetical protein